MIKSSSLNLMPICLSVFFVLTFSGSSASDEGIETAQYGSWTVQCELPPEGALRSCFMFQQLVERNAGKPVLQLSIGLVPSSNSPSLLISLPLGISLVPGILLQIDDGPITKFPVERCEPQGCRAAAKIRPETIEQMKRGDFLKVTFHDGHREPITVQVALGEFERGYNELLQSGAPSSNLKQQMNQLGS